MNTPTTSNQRSDLYTRVTERVVADLERGEPREDHSAYLAHWIAVLKEDKRAIFAASAHAQKAVDFLHGLQPNATSSEQTSSGLSALGSRTAGIVVRPSPKPDPTR